MANIAIPHMLVKLALLSGKEKALRTWIMLRFLNRDGNGSQYAFGSAHDIARLTGHSLATIYRHLQWLQEQGLLEKITPEKWKITGKEAIHKLLKAKYGLNYQFLNLGKRASKSTFRAEVSSSKMTLYSISPEHLATPKLFIQYIRFLMLAETVRRQSAKSQSRKRRKSKAVRYRSSKENAGPQQGKISLASYGELIGRKQTASHRAIRSLVSANLVVCTSHRIELKIGHHPGAREALELAYPGYHFHPIKDGYRGDACNEYTILHPHKRSRRSVR